MRKELSRENLGESNYPHHTRPDGSQGVAGRVSSSFRTGFNASSIPAAKIRPLSDTLSLFDAVPFFGLSCVWLRLERQKGSTFALIASYGYSIELSEFRRVHAAELGRGTIVGRTILDGKPIQVEDVQADPGYTYKDAARVGNVRTALGVPLVREGSPIGVFFLSRTTVRPFTDSQIDLVTTFADQAVIAIENARLLNELRQSLEQQTATSEVLQVISSSPGDLDPVFTTMLEKAVHICDAKYGTLYLPDDGRLRLVAAYDVPEFFAARRGVAFDPTPGGGLDEALRAKRPVQIPDLAATKSYIERHPGMVEAVELAGIRTGLAVPMLKDDDLIGIIAIHRREVLPFTDKQIDLVKNFAAQAVIAIENARLLNELRQRTTDLSQRTTDLMETLEQQIATSEVLKVISGSPGDLQPVFDTMLANATRLCEATHGHVWTFDGEQMCAVAVRGDAPFVKWLQDHNPVRPIPGSAAERIVQGEHFVHVTDRRQEPAYRDNQTFRELVDTSGIRASLSVALRKGETLLGMINVYRQEVRPFTDNQIELVENFAAQAVIAIENARLLNELRQSLEQQTATSQVLQVISSSPGDLQHVFATMLENATRICEAKFGALYLSEGDGFRATAMNNAPPAYEEARAGILHPPPSTSLWRAANTKQAVQIADVRSERGYVEHDPFVVSAVALGGYRSVLSVPMLHEDELVGVITIFRQEVRPFTDEQISLVQNFAAQAVIAIENARLLNELRQSLERQTATSEVLQVISSSPGDLQPVFAAMLENAARICDANFGNIFRWDGEALRLIATHNTPPAFAEARRRLPLQPNRVNPIGHMLATQKTVHIADLAADPRYTEQHDPDVVIAVELGRIRTFVAVPMLKENKLIGALIVYRQEVRPFTDKQIALVENFAAQAVIAIENTRLLNELHERTDQLQAQSKELADLNQQLEHRVADQVGEIERMSRLRRFLPPQVADLIVASGAEKQLESHRREITALFCDLRGFTGFTESADAEDVIALLREYHAAVGEKIIKYSGTLERYAGDGVMVVFNDPVPVENPALQAVLMALEMRDAIGALAETWHRWGHDIGFGIGIAHGFATLGTIGFEGRFDYAAIGTVSNVASRLCDEAKPGQILISPRVLTKVENAVKVEPVGEFELKGIRRPLAAYNVVAASPSKV